MGGRGSGGSRTGAGKKPKSALMHSIGGNAGKRRGAVVLAHPNSTAIPQTERFEPPEELFILQIESDVRVQDKAAIAVWHELAPHAFDAGTLTRASAASFSMMCRAIVKERRLSSSAIDCGGADHRGLMQRVSTWMKDFALSPLGKPLRTGSAPAPATPANPLDRFLRRRRG